MRPKPVSPHGRSERCRAQDSVYQSVPDHQKTVKGPCGDHSVDRRAIEARKCGQTPEAKANEWLGPANGDLGKTEGTLRPGFLRCAASGLTRRGRTPPNRASAPPSPGAQTVPTPRQPPGQETSDAPVTPHGRSTQTDSLAPFPRPIEPGAEGDGYTPPVPYVCFVLADDRLSRELGDAANWLIPGAKRRPIGR
jgi:hypothetical protein